MQVSQRSAYAAAAVLFLVALFNNLDRALISILQVPLKAELGLSDAQLGALTGLAFAAVYGVSALSMGFLVDRYRRTWLLAAAITLWTSLTAISGLATSYLFLVICRFGVAFGEACAHPATFSLLADYFHPRRRGTVFSIWPVAAFVGVLVGVFAGGWLTSIVGWRSSFIYIGLAGLILVPALLLLPEPKRGQFEEEEGAQAHAASQPAFFQSIKELLKIPTFRVLIIAMTLQTFVTATFLNWTAPFLSRAHDLPIQYVGLWTGLPIGIGGGIGALLSGFMIDRFVQRSPAWYGWAPAIAALVLFPVGLVQFLIPSTPVSVGFSFLTGVLTSFYLAPCFAAAQALVSSAMRGVTTAVLAIFPSMFGTGLGPLVTGVLSDTLLPITGDAGQALRYALVIAFTPSLAAAFAFYLLGRSFQSRSRDAALQPA